MITPVWRLFAINNDVSEWKTNIVFILWSLSLQIWYKTWSGEVSNFLLSSSLCGSWVAWLLGTSSAVTTVTHTSTMYGVVAKWCCFTHIWYCPKLNCVGANYPELEAQYSTLQYSTAQGWVRRWWWHTGRYARRWGPGDNVWISPAGTKTRALSCGCELDPGRESYLGRAGADNGRAEEIRI